MTPYSCSYCGERFESRYDLGAHVAGCQLAVMSAQVLSVGCKPQSNQPDLAEQLQEAKACLKALWEHVPTEPLMELGKRIRGVLGET